MKKLMFPVLVATTLLTSASNAIVIRHDVDDAEYHASVEDFPPLTTLYKVGAHGTLIAPQWVATAAHAVFCVEPGDQIKVENTLMTVEARYTHHLYERGEDHDIALLKLSEPSDTTPARIYRQNDETGKVIRFIGSGGTGNGNEGQSVSYKQNGGQMRMAENTVRDTSDNEIFFTFNKGKDALPLEGVSGNGDSGGPAFMQSGDNYLLLGISSRADSLFKEMGEYGVNEVYTRLSYYQHWIDEVMLETPEFIQKFTTQARFPQPEIIDQLDAVCEMIGF